MVCRPPPPPSLTGFLLDCTPFTYMYVLAIAIIQLVHYVGIIFVNDKFVGQKQKQYKYGLTVITPRPAPGQPTEQPKVILILLIVYLYQLLE